MRKNLGHEEPASLVQLFVTYAPSRHREQRRGNATKAQSDR